MVSPTHVQGLQRMPATLLEHKWVLRKPKGAGLLWQHWSLLCTNGHSFAPVVTFLQQWSLLCNSGHYTHSLQEADTELSHLRMRLELDASYLLLSNSAKERLERQELVHVNDEGVPWEGAELALQKRCMNGYGVRLYMCRLVPFVCISVCKWILFYPCACVSCVSTYVCVCMCVDAHALSMCAHVCICVYQRMHASAVGPSSAGSKWPLL